MNYLLYGFDTYRSRKKLNEIIGAFTARAGTASSVHRFDAEESDIRAVKGALETDSLFATKKMVVVEYAISAIDDFESFLQLVERNVARKDSVLVIWDRGFSSADEKKHIAKLEPYCEKTQEFKVLEGESLKRWILEEAKQRGIILSREAMAPLVSYGGDLWRTANELEKLSLSALAGGRAATPETNVFLLGDTFFGNQRDALKNLLQHFERGEDDFAVFSYLANHTRTLCTVKNYLERNQAIPAVHKIHPFVAKKASGIARMLSGADLTAVFGRFFEEDHKIKIGLSRPKESLIRIRTGA